MPRCYIPSSEATCRTYPTSDEPWQAKRKGANSCRVSRLARATPSRPCTRRDNMYRPLLSPLGRDDGGRAHSDGRGVWWRGRASDHAAGERAVRWRERPGGWGQFHRLARTGGTLALERQGSLQSGEQERQLPVVSVERAGLPRKPNFIFFLKKKNQETLRSTEPTFPSLASQSSALVQLFSPCFIPFCCPTDRSSS